MNDTIINHTYMGTIFINILFEAIEGLHFGAGSGGSGLGDIDNRTVRDILFNVPLAPGSGIKGKGAYVLRKYGSAAHDSCSASYIMALHGNDPSEKCPDIQIADAFCPYCRVTGIPAGIARTRFDDARLTADTLQMLANRNTQSPFAEVKTENVINPIDGEATPRKMERIPKGSILSFGLAYDIRGGVDFVVDLQFILDMLFRFEFFHEKLGGSATRASGKVSIWHASVTYKLPHDIADPAPVISRTQSAREICAHFESLWEKRQQITGSDCTGALDTTVMETRINLLRQAAHIDPQDEKGVKKFFKGLLTMTGQDGSGWISGDQGLQSPESRIHVSRHEMLSFLRQVWLFISGKNNSESVREYAAYLKPLFPIVDVLETISAQADTLYRSLYQGGRRELCIRALDIGANALLRIVKQALDNGNDDTASLSLPGNGDSEAQQTVNLNKIQACLDNVTAEIEIIKRENRPIPDAQENLTRLCRQAADTLRTVEGLAVYATGLEMILGHLEPKPCVSGSACHGV